jgi:hypothetical protein
MFSFIIPIVAKVFTAVFSSVIVSKAFIAIQMATMALQLIAPKLGPVVGIVLQLSMGNVDVRSLLTQGMNLVDPKVAAAAGLLFDQQGAGFGFHLLGQSSVRRVWEERRREERRGECGKRGEERRGEE